MVMALSAALSGSSLTRSDSIMALAGSALMMSGAEKFQILL
jgi:hypothetical protein